MIGSTRQDVQALCKYHVLRRGLSTHSYGICDRWGSVSASSPSLSDSDSSYSENIITEKVCFSLAAPPQTVSLV